MTKTLAAVTALLLSLSALGAEDPHAVRSSVPIERNCERACLYRVLDGYLEALRRRDPWRIGWSKDALSTENNVVLQIGDGLWGTLSKLESYDLRMADPVTGQVAMFGAVEESGGGLAVRRAPASA